MQKAKEKKARRDKAGRAYRASGSAGQDCFWTPNCSAPKTAPPATAVIAERMIDDRTDALADARARVEILTPLTIELPKTGLPGSRELIAFDEVVMAHGDRRLFGPLSFAVRGPERVAIRGANGSGKTTLLRLISRRSRANAGDVRRLTDRIAMLDQHVEPARFQPQAFSITCGASTPNLSDNAAHAALARFAFRNKAALQIAGTLSGGERLRAGMACVFARRAAASAVVAGRADQPSRPRIDRSAGRRAGRSSTAR